jgi:hypothetical protein
MIQLGQHVWPYLACVTVSVGLNHVKDMNFSAFVFITLPSLKTTWYINEKSDQSSGKELTYKNFILQKVRFQTLPGHQFFNQSKSMKFEKHVHTTESLHHFSV